MGTSASTSQGQTLPTVLVVRGTRQQQEGGEEPSATATRYNVFENWAKRLEICLYPCSLRPDITGTFLDGSIPIDSFLATST